VADAERLYFAPPPYHFQARNSSKQGYSSNLRVPDPGHSQLGTAGFDRPKGSRITGQPEVIKLKNERRHRDRTLFSHADGNRKRLLFSIFQAKYGSPESRSQKTQGSYLEEVDGRVEDVS